MNLTHLELMALDSPVNVSDGHARQSLTPSQQAIVDRFPDLFATSLRTSFAELEREAQETFFAALGQSLAPVAEGRVLSAYSSSVAMDILARCLAEEIENVALVHPTFDNIPDILRGRSLRLLPVTQAELEGDPERTLRDDPGAVFVTTPNNPTGWVLKPECLLRLAEWCANKGAVLCLDTSFRGFDPAAQYDTYEILDGTGVEYVVIEDSGKLWPMAELKLGFICRSRSCRLAIEDVVSDILLSVSPFVLSVVRLLAEDGAAGGFDALHDLIEANRRTVGARLDPTLACLPDVSKVSVARVALADGLSADAAWRALRTMNVEVLPCAAFHWAEPRAGDAYVRLALARDSEVVVQAADAVAQVVALMAEQQSALLRG